MEEKTGRYQGKKKVRKRGGKERRKRGGRRKKGEKSGWERKKNGKMALE